MCIFKSIYEKHKKKIETINNKCDELVTLISCAISEIKYILNDMSCYIDPIRGQSVILKYNKIFQDIRKENILVLKKAKQYKKLNALLNELSGFVLSFESNIKIHNDAVAKNRLNFVKKTIGDVEGRQLDEQQMMCIAKDMCNHLVIAGAGTGKTTTIIGRVKYLLNTHRCQPEDILILSFTNASASEMQKRIKKETGYDIDVLTFHKLGLDIITKVDGIKPKIADINMRKFIREQINICMQSPHYANILYSYVLHNNGMHKSEFDFDKESEYTDYLKINPPTTLNKEVVKSYGEVDIANFLFENGIRYIYEHPYKIDTRTNAYGEYKPDFYLPDYEIYIEYFALNKNGEVPDYFKSAKGKTPTQTYCDSIEWKRATHKAYQTKMIECYAYEKEDDTLLDLLKQKLKENGVLFNKKNYEQLWNEIITDKDVIMDGIVELMETVINLLKSNEYTIDDVKKMISHNRYKKTNARILFLVEPIYHAYNNYLRINNLIDFNDMINRAKNYVNQRKYINTYKFVMVDEYQDISKARFELLKNLRMTGYFDLFCVGDDWQSIYRFAGSDIGFILKFANYWGPAEISKIETTYRFSQQLIDISSNFVMKNPNQIKKAIRGKHTRGYALGDISGYTDKYATEFMLRKLDDLPQNSSVFFIGRYTNDVNLLSDNPCLSCKYQHKDGVIQVIYTKRKDLRMQYITAHKSKGLQADYVFIINNKCGKMGFPSKIQENPLVDLLLVTSDFYPYAEERRLFYVALTRSKEKTFLLTVDNINSEFATELKTDYEREIREEKFSCPWCGGKLIKKSGSYGEFLGCSNYRITGCKYKRNIRNA